MATNTACPAAGRGRRCRPLRIENDDTPWFVSSRTIEERFWLHPLLTSALLPRNADANRRCRRLQARTDKRLAKLVAKANSMRGPLQPALGVDEVKRIVRGIIGSALARAQKKFKTVIYALIVMSDHVLCAAAHK